MKYIVFILILFFSGSGITLYAQNPDSFGNVDFIISPLTEINTNESEISPQFVNDELYFTSAAGNAGQREKDAPFYDVYKVEMNENGEPVSEKELVEGFGKPFHEGPVSYCKKTGELFVTVSNLTDNSGRTAVKNKHVRLGLVVMKLIEGKWTKTYNFPYNSSEYNIAHPAIDPSGDTLVFSSNMKGGFGNSDLYMSVRKNGIWSKPENLGERINTPGNEMFPVFGPDGLLFFSSDSHEPNYGQLDIYFTTLSGDEKPVNPGNRLNSAMDDFGMTVHPSKKFGYFSSNRNSWNKDDVFHVEFVPMMEDIRGKVIASHNLEPVRNAVVYLQDCEGNLLKSVTTGFLGNFEFRVPKGGCYHIYSDFEGFLSEPVAYTGNQFVDLRLKQVINYKIIVEDFEDAGIISEAEVTCGGFQWISDNAGIIDVKLDTLYDCNAAVTKEGYFDYFFDLNPERFKPGVDVIDTIRLVRKDKGRKLRLETVDYFIDMWRLMPKSEPELDEILKLLNDNPSLKIEISSHTDSRQEDGYNLWLSQKRADSVKEYLVEKGVPHGRIVATGYGETRLLNHCSNYVICSEALHLVNRRTEMVILDY